MIRTLFIIIWTVWVTALFGTLAIIASVLFKDSKWPHLVARVWARSILFAGRIKVSVRGLANLDSRHSCIYMSNHQSNFDIPVLLGYLPVQFRWLAKMELFKIPLFGLAMRRAGYISIDRSNRKAAFRSLKKAAEIIRNGVSVLIFPEGTRSRDGHIMPFKKGGFVLAVDAGVPIVPIVIHGTRAIMPKKQTQIKPGHVVLEIVPPVETSGYSRKTKDDLMQNIRQTICTVFEKGGGIRRC